MEIKTTEDVKRVFESMMAKAMSDVILQRNNIYKLGIIRSVSPSSNRATVTVIGTGEVLNNIEYSKGIANAVVGDRCVVAAISSGSTALHFIVSVLGSSGYGSVTLDTLNNRLGACHLFSSANQAIPSGSFTGLTFGSGEEVVDDLNMHDTSTNTDRITANIAGIYLVYANMRFDANSVGFRILDIYKNGSASGSVIATCRADVDPGGRWGGSCVVPVSLATDNYVTAEVIQTSGGNLNAVERSFGCILLKAL